MTIKLFIDYISQPSRAVLAFCKLSKIHVEIHEIRIAKLQHLEEDFKKVNPMKKVPAMHDTEIELFLAESPAIVSYLARKYNKFELFKPQGDEMIYAKVEEYLHYHHTNTRKCALLLYTHLFSKLYPVQQPTINDPKILQAQLAAIFEHLQGYYFKNSEFMLGSRLTVADLLAFFQMQTLEILGFDFSKYPKLLRWMRAIQKIDQVQETNLNYKKMVPKMKSLRASL